MNKINCNIIKDILPLHIDNVVSEDTKVLVESHLLNCNECKKELLFLKSDLETSEVVITEKDDIAFLKKIGLDIRKKRVFTGIISAVITAIVVILSFAYLTAPEYLAYTESFDIVTANEKEDIITLSFTGEYELTLREQGEYEISIYNTAWNNLFDAAKSQTITVNPNNEEVNTIYYVSNGEQLDKIIYGENPSLNGGVLTLPRLFLNHYIKIAAFLSIVLIAILLLFRRNHKFSSIITMILFLPISYSISHLIITGLNATSYSATREFYLILLLTIPIYFILYIIYKKKINY